MHFHKPVLTPQQVETRKQARAAEAEARAAEAAARATEEKLADWVLDELRSGRTLSELKQQWATESLGVDLAAIVDRRLDLAP